MALHPILLTVQGRLGGLFDAQQLLTDVSGSGNNWAHGHHLYGPQYRDNLLESIRRPVEACESLQSFLLLQSLGGGTGSGLGCYILNLLEVGTVDFQVKASQAWSIICAVMPCRLSNLAVHIQQAAHCMLHKTVLQHVKTRWCSVAGSDVLFTLVITVTTSLRALLLEQN